jgi:hypothetical protein
MTPVLHSLYHTSLSTTIFITMAITVERFHAVCNPTPYKSRLIFYGKNNLVLLYSLPAVATASLLNIPQVGSRTFSYTPAGIITLSSMNQ